MSLDIGLDTQHSTSPFVYSTPVNTECNQCKGCCLDEKNNASTQAAALKMFGYIPNNCVSNSNGNSRCPYASANINKKKHVSITI